MPGGVYKTSVYGHDHTDLPDNLTESRAFEWKARRYLESHYPTYSHDYLDNEQVEHNDGESDCPDLVINIQETDQCVCVADSKLRKKLTKAEVKKVAKYRDRRNASRAIVFIPQDCHIQRGARKKEKELLVEIIILPR